MLSPGTYLQGRYRIVRQIGKGGMGCVYQAFDEAVDCAVAIKETLASTNELQRAFRHEAKLLANLRHSALPRVTHHFRDGEGLFLVMDYIDGDNLEQLLTKRGAPFTYPEVLEIAEKLLDAIEYLHSFQEPIIHRDIKPANIKLTDDNRVFLLDFGLAKGTLDSRATLGSDVLSVYGYSAHYAPLEQITGSGTTAHSDLFSLGATLYHLLTGKLPASAGSRYNALEEELEDPLIPVNSIIHNVPVALSETIEKATQLSPRKRFSTARDMKLALRSAARVVNTRVVRTRLTAETASILASDSTVQNVSQSVQFQRDTEPIPRTEDEITLKDSSAFHMAKTYVSRLFTGERAVGEQRFELAVMPKRRRGSVILMLLSVLLASFVTVGFLAFTYFSTRPTTNAPVKPDVVVVDDTNSKVSGFTNQAELADLTDSARKAVDRGIDLDNKGLRREAESEFSSAAHLYRQALTLSPEDHRLHANLGSVYVYWRNWPEARTAYLAALNQDPDNTEYRSQLEKLNAKLGSVVKVPPQNSPVKPKSAKSNIEKDLIH